MAHIHTDPGQHDHTVSAYVARLVDGEPQILLHVHKKLNQWLQFGGHIELDENPWQAISHELAEESGYEIKNLVVLQPPLTLRALPGVVTHPTPVSYLTHFFNSAHLHTDTAFAFLVDSLPTRSIDNGESQQLKWFTTTELAAPDANIPQNVREIAWFVLETCVAEWERISPELYG